MILQMNAVFVELSVLHAWADSLDDADFRGLQEAMLKNPEAGEHQEIGTGGKAMKKRNLFAEIAEGFDALSSARTGKQTLRTHEVELHPAPDVTADEVLALRERLHLSRPVFARYLRINPRTLENWEQGRAKPNAQAALLIRLVEKFPDTVDRLAVV